MISVITQLPEFLDCSVLYFLTFHEFKYLLPNLISFWTGRESFSFNVLYYVLIACYLNANRRTANEASLTHRLQTTEGQRYVVQLPIDFSCVEASQWTTPSCIF